MIEKMSIKQSGFSLVEVLISISVLLVVLGGITSLAVGTVRTSATNKYQIEAYGQAQKQLELVRQIRNTNNIDGKTNTTWKSDLAGNNLAVGVSYCYQLGANYRPEIKVGSCNWSSDETGMDYRTKTIFSFVKDPVISNQKNLKVKATTSWQEGDQQKQVELETVLTNWYWSYE